MLWITTGIIVSYLIGSIPTAYLFGRWLKGLDIRQAGSGNVGATNALRVLGKGPGIAVLALDILKGYLATFFLSELILAKTALSADLAGIVLGLSCIAGHNWTIFLRFKGGKGMAATLGVLLALAFKMPDVRLVLGLLILTWLIIFILSRIVSLASLISAIALPVVMALFKQRPNKIMITASLILGFLVILRHKSNLIRLFRGQEPRLNLTK